MAPVYRIRNPDATYTDISAYFRLYKLDVATNAEEGSVAQSTITAHDPDGTFDIVGHRQLRIHEDTATGSNTMIYVGFTGDRRISRGPSRTTVGADWEIDLLDPNSILARRILTGSDSNRPAETDVARIQWLVSTNESGMVNDSLYVNTTGPVAMDAKDYTGQRFNEVIDDCAQASGKNYHLWYRESTGTFSLWYDFDYSNSQTSPLRLTNVASEVDSSLTFAISDDTQMTRSPDRVNSGVFLPFDGAGSPVYVQNGTTSNTYARRDIVMPAENVTTLVKATARANRYLTTMTTEEDVITTTVVLPAAKVNFLTAGMRVQFKATHLPGREAFDWARVLNRSVLQISEEFYAVKVELTVLDAVTATVTAPTATTRLSYAYTADVGAKTVVSGPSTWDWSLGGRWGVTYTVVTTGDWLPKWGANPETRWLGTIILELGNAYMRASSNWSDGVNQGTWPFVSGWTTNANGSGYRQFSFNSGLLAPGHVTPTGLVPDLFVDPYVSSGRSTSAVVVDLTYVQTHNPDGSPI